MAAVVLVDSLTGTEDVLVAAAVAAAQELMLVKVVEVVEKEREMKIPIREEVTLEVGMDLLEVQIMVDKVRLVETTVMKQSVDVVEMVVT